SCRNVLIYLSPQVHKRCIPQFHHALNPSGYLVLGSAESIGTFNELFDVVDKKNKIYAKKVVPKPRPADLIRYEGPLFGSTTRSTARSCRLKLLCTTNPGYWSSLTRRHARTDQVNCLSR